MKYFWITSALYVASQAFMYIYVIIYPISNINNSGLLKVAIPTIIYLSLLIGYKILAMLSKWYLQKRKYNKFKKQFTIKTK